MAQSKRGEPDFAPLMLFGFMGIAVAGVATSLALYERLRAARRAPAAPESPPETPPTGEPTS